MSNILSRGKRGGVRRRAAGVLAGVGLALGLSASAWAAPSSLDMSLGGGGSVITPIGNAGDTLRATVIQPDGKIVAVGYANTGSNDDFAVVRYNADGSMDASFGGGDGIVTTPVLNGADQAFAVALQADGKIVGGGQVFNGSNTDFALVRYNTDGTLDTSFDGDGKRTLAVGGGYDFIHDIAIQPDGKIVAAGATSGPNFDFLVARLQGNEKLNEIANFDTDRKADVSLWNPTNRNWYFINSTDGATRTHNDWGSGSLGDMAVPGDYDGDGLADIAIYRASEGNWYILDSTTGAGRIVTLAQPGVPVASAYLPR